MNNRRMNGHPSAAGDEPDNFIAGHRIAALPEPDQHIVDTIDLDGTGRLLLSLPSFLKLGFLLFTGSANFSSTKACHS